MTDTLMTEATTTNDGAPASQDVGSDSPTGVEQPADGQQASDGQNQSNATEQSDGNTEGDQEGDKPAQGAPEKYDFKFEEGKTVDAGILDVYSEVAKDLNLTQEAAQKMLDKIAPVIEGKQLQRIEAVKNEWTQASMTDTEFGGDRLQENLQVAESALAEFGTDQLRSLLKESGLANNPEVIRFMYRAGKSLSEDKFIGGNKGQKQKGPMTFTDHAAALYSNQQN